MKSLIIPNYQTGLYAGKITELFSPAGITLNGPQPFDFQVNHPDVFRRILKEGSLGLGESYVEGWWDCEKLDQFFTKLLSADVKDCVGKNMFFVKLLTLLFNKQSLSKSYLNVRRHYDLGNDLFINMLDRRLTYTCAYWKGSSTLDEAQEAKLELTCRKLGLKPGMRVLDIGCGWGSFAKYANEKYAVFVTGITLSKEQIKWSHEFCSAKNVDIQLLDYRNITGQFDCIVSLGMFEHVGFNNFKVYFETVFRHLRKGGLFLLQTIGSLDSNLAMDAWMSKYIFPNAFIPSLKQILQASEKYFVVEDVHNFGADYDKTLMAWNENFVSNWSKLKNNYDRQFFRMWQYFLLSCAGSFRARNNQLWQIVFSKQPSVGYDFR